MNKSIRKTNEYFKITGCAMDDEKPISSSPGKYSIQGIHHFSYEIAITWKPTGGENKVSSSAQSLEVHAQDNSCATFTGSAATAETHYDFIPTTGKIALKLAGHVDMHDFENSLTLKLVKIDGDIEVDNKTWTTEVSSGLDINEQLEYNVAPGIEHRIILLATVSTGDSPGANSSLKVTIV